MIETVAPPQQYNNSASSDNDHFAIRDVTDEVSLTGWQHLNLQLQYGNEDEEEELMSADYDRLDMSSIGASKPEIELPAIVVTAPPPDPMPTIAVCCILLGVVYTF